MTRVLLVEDHDTLRSLTAAHLSERGFVIDEAASAAAARAALAVGVYDAMIVDLGLPDEDGAQLLRERRREDATPALIITARDGVSDRIAGLNAGADDYIVKPFDLEELEARLRAVLRRPGRRKPVELRLGLLAFDTVSRQARVGEELLALRRRETHLLEALLHSANRIVVRDSLEERLYGFEDPVTPNALEVTVSRLRRALEEANAGVRLETRRGIGYMLRAEEGFA